MKYRRLDASGDMVFGGGLAAFWQDRPEAVAQAVGTRLRLWSGEWFLDLTEGTTWQANVLGPRTQSTRDAIIRARILGTLGVSGVDALSSSYDPVSRRYIATVRLSTIYGPATVPVSVAV